MSIIAWIVIGLMLAGALGLLLAWGPLSPTHRHRDSDGGYDSGTPVLVRAEKRLYQHQDWQPLPDEHRACQGRPPLRDKKDQSGCLPRLRWLPRGLCRGDRGDQAHRSERCQDRSRTVSAASARLRWHLKYCVAPGGYTLTRTLDHGGLDLYTPMFAPCLLRRPGTGRQNTVLTPLPLAWLRCSSACHSIPVTQVFKKVSLSSGLLICGPETAGCRLYRYISAIWLLLLMPRNVPGTPRKRTDLAWPSIRHARRDGRRSGPPRAERQPPHAVPHVSRSATGRATRR